MITKDYFTRVNNDLNGNPRYVIHFLDCINDKESEEVEKSAKPFKSILDKYDFAINKMRKLGGKKYRGKDFGGGIVFQSYNLQDLANEINEANK